MANLLLMAITHNARTIASGVLMVLTVAMSILLVIIILMQKGNTNDVGAITGGNSETYYGKNKARNVDSRLKILTIILGILVAVIAIVFFIIAPTA
ncbi:MAG: preprotein translocase subunit SecG [Clostridia bacterium]|nr:preprotein translocase subunit SecG [Clostridia bacterium]